MRPDWLVLPCTLFACWSGELQQLANRPGAVSGRVTGGTSNAGVAVLAVGGFPPAGLPPTIRSTKSGPDGRFILTEVSPGPINIVANDCRGFAAAQGITAFPAETSEIGDLPLRPISEVAFVDGLGCTGQP